MATALKIAILLVILVLAGYALLVLYVRRSMRHAARQEFRAAYDMYSTLHEWRRCEPHEFEDLDLEFYAQTQATLEGLGFRVLGDLEDVTAHAVTGMPRTFIRCMVGDDGGTMAGFYHVRLPEIKRGGAQVARVVGETRVVEFDTHLGDGYSVTTTPLSSRMLPDETPGSIHHHMPGAGPEALLEKHREHVASFMRRHPDVAPNAVHSLEDVLALLHVSQARTNAYRQEIGYLTDDEVERLTGRLMPDAMREAFSAEVAKLRKQYLETGQLPW